VPAYKLAKFLSEKLNNILQLCNTFPVSEFTQQAHDLSNLKINSTNGLIRRGTRDLYVNLPVTKILHVTATLTLQQS
jgi:hypothetical protein